MTRDTMIFIAGLVCGGGFTDAMYRHNYIDYLLWGTLTLFLGICSFDWKGDKKS